MAAMPSLDIVSRIDFAELDNAINNAKKAVTARFDFKNCRAEFEIDRKEKKLKLFTEDGKMNALKEMFLHAAAKRGLSMKSFVFEEAEPGAAGGVKCEAKIIHGLDQDTAKSIVKLVKDSKLKVQASIQGEEVRLTGKQIDDLREVMAMLTKAELAVPLQFVNMKS